MQEDDSDEENEYEEDGFLVDEAEVRGLERWRAAGGTKGWGRPACQRAGMPLTPPTTCVAWQEEEGGGGSDDSGAPHKKRKKRRRGHQLDEEDYALVEEAMGAKVCALGGVHCLGSWPSGVARARRAEP